MGASSEANNDIVGVIKKTLKRQESGSMKMKHLAKSILEKFSDSHTKSTVRQVIEENDMFHVDGKVVMLKKKASSSKKRKSMGDSTSNDSGEDVVDNSNSDSAKDKKKAAKKDKKSKKK